MEVSDFDATSFMTKKEARRADRFTQLAVAASRLALDDSGVEGTAARDRIGVMIGSGGEYAELSSEEARHILIEARG